MQSYKAIVTNAVMLISSNDYMIKQWDSVGKHLQQMKDDFMQRPDACMLKSRQPALLILYKTDLSILHLPFSFK